MIRQRQAAGLVSADGADRIGGMTTTSMGLAAIYAEREPAMRSIRSPLPAEIWASELLGMVRLAVTPIVRDEAVAAFTVDFAKVAEREGDATGLATVRALAAVSAGPVRAELDLVARRMVNAGIKDRSWAATVGHPAVGRCLQHRDAETHQQTVIAEFGYGRARHAVVVLIDHDLGGGIKDTWVADDADALLAEVHGNTVPGLIVEDLDWPTVRQLWAQALTCPECPMEDDQIEEVPMNRAIVLARLALDPAGDAASPATARAAAPAVGGRRPATPRRKVVQVKVSLRGAKPPIWRRLELPASVTLDELHEAIQEAFGWTGYHLHVFEAGGQSYGDPDPELEFRSEFGVRLSRVAPVGTKLTYTYDFGDDWQHVIEVEKQVPAVDGVTYPRCTAARRAAPPEDCGGIWGYEALLEMSHRSVTGADGGLTDEEREYLEVLPESFDPAAVDLDEINGALAHRAG
jgi:hypothetical protein